MAERVDGRAREQVGRRYAALGVDAEDLAAEILRILRDAGIAGAPVPI